MSYDAPEKMPPAHSPSQRDHRQPSRDTTPSTLRGDDEETTPPRTHRVIHEVRSNGRTDVDAKDAIIQELVSALRAKDQEVASLRHQIEELQRMFAHHIATNGGKDRIASPNGQQRATTPRRTRVGGPMISPTPFSPDGNAVASMLDQHEKTTSGVSDAVEKAKRRIALKSSKLADDYILESGGFRTKDSKLSVIAQAPRSDPPIVTGDISKLTPRRQVELYGAVARQPTPGPASYSPLYNRAATPTRRR